MDPQTLLAIGSASAGRSSHCDQDALSSLAEEMMAVRGLPVVLGGGTAPPPGTKSALAPWAEILIGLGAAGALLPTALGVLRDWLMRQPPSITLRLKTNYVEFELSGAAKPSEIDAVIEKLLASKS